MFFEKWTLFFCLVVCGGCLFGLYRLGETEPQPQERPQPQVREVTEPQSTVRGVSQPAPDINNDFYQTIIDNNLFAPLGTVLNPKPVPGAHLKLIGTFVSKDAVHSTAIIKNETTGRQEMLSIGEGIAEDFQVVEIQPKQVTFDHNGTSVVLRLPSTLLLNAKRR